MTKDSKKITLQYQILEIHGVRYGRTDQRNSIAPLSNTREIIQITVHDIQKVKSGGRIYDYIF